MEAIYYLDFRKGYGELDLVYKMYNNNIKRRDNFPTHPIMRGRGNNYRGRGRGGRSTINTILR